MGYTNTSNLNGVFSDGGPMPPSMVTDCEHFRTKYFGNIVHEECSINHYEPLRPCSRYKKRLENTEQPRYQRVEQLDRVGYLEQDIYGALCAIDKIHAPQTLQAFGGRGD